jgi:hypothetical protein
MTSIYKTSESQRKASKKYVNSNKEHISTRMKSYYLINKEKIKQRRMERYYEAKSAKAELAEAKIAEAKIAEELPEIESIEELSEELSQAEIDQYNLLFDK